MNKTLISFLFLLVLFCGCKKENTTAPNQTTGGSGALLMKIDRQNAPAGVAVVTAFLYRPGSDTLSASTNIISDTSAILAFGSVSTGNWQLRVDAKSDSGVLLYSGQSTVVVYANQTTNVSLVLQPVPGSTGSVIISVLWGTLPVVWSDYISNPVLLATSSVYETGGVKQCQVVYDGLKYRMWYQGTVNSAGCYILYAESGDGNNWFKMNNTMPVLNGTLEWESGGLSPGAVMKDGNIFRMYYGGQNSSRTIWCTGLAVSTNGINWERVTDQPVLSPVGSEGGIVCNSVVKVNGTYFLYYQLGGNPGPRIYVATSTDGINFQRYSGNPILTATAVWESPGIYEPGVIYENNQFKMVYTNNNDPTSAFGMAFSSDGLHWQKATDNPFFRNTQTYNNWGNASIGYPCFLKSPVDYRIYYTGHSSAGMYDKIGYVKKPL